MFGSRGARRRWFPAIACCLGLLTAPAAWADSPVGRSQTQVPIQGVTLFSSGVGYFKHAGTVTGAGTTELRFKTDQINDILKSLWLEDLDGGTIGSVLYPSQDPLGKILRSFQIDITNNPSFGELLTQLRGAKVKGQANAEQFEGTILGLEKKKKAVGEKGHVVELWALNLSSETGIRSILLEDVQRLEFDEARLREELAQALAAVADARDQTKKVVNVQFQGRGERRVRLGYVIETPVWKTSYRLILGGQGNDQSTLQGWAIIENQTDSDWNHVGLSLISGRPISFIQQLYQPLYVPRPLVQPELYGSLRPQTYESGIAGDRLETTQSPIQDAEMAAGKMFQAPAPADMARRKSLRRDEFKAAAEAGGATAPDPMAGVTAAAAAAQVGDLFQYRVADVSLPRQRSAMIPIVADSIEAERVSIYNPAVLPKNPLTGAKLTNNTGKHLLQGPVTVFDDHVYAGDARLDTIPPGQERWISYGIDQQIHVSFPHAKSTAFIQSGRIIKGLLHLSRKQQAVQEYMIDSKAEHEKTLIVEHAFRSGWTLVESPKPLETTETLYRFKESVLAGKTAKLTVKEETVESETIMLLPADPGQVEFYSRTGEISKEVRETLAKAATMKGTMVETQRMIQEKQRELTEIRQEQERIRANLTATSKGTTYYDRLLKKLNDQETRIEQVQTETEQLRRTLHQQQRELEKFLTNLSVG